MTIEGVADSSTKGEVIDELLANKRGKSITNLVIADASFVEPSSLHR